ncbi:methyltransferase-like protein 23 isoform X2 [Acipenser ruthenus]|uniref:methyltransferase-like protein 23 isoform X2 n=1 Tax=Acipenser ruthenus TaxID=7906 RepID=UPI0027423204|nr:methyltransferase-like protein 23 isoform X2 [Acipenser ruthenus]
MKRTMCEQDCRAGGGNLKHFNFKAEDQSRSEGARTLRVSIPEVLEPQYGMYVWPCAVVLAQYVWHHKEALQQKSVLEIGAGVSLPGVVAGRCGARVILSDSAELPACLENCRRSCEVNGLRDVSVVGLTWGQVSPDLLILPALDIILGSDVFYEPEDFEDVLVTVFFLLRRNPQAQFWTTYQERRPGGDLPIGPRFSVSSQGRSTRRVSDLLRVTHSESVAELELNRQPSGNKPLSLTTGPPSFLVYSPIQW